MEINAEQQYLVNLPYLLTTYRKVWAVPRCAEGLGDAMAPCLLCSWEHVWVKPSCLPGAPVSLHGLHWKGFWPSWHPFPCPHPSLSSPPPFSSQIRRAALFRLHCHAQSVTSRSVVRAGRSNRHHPTGSMGVSMGLKKRDFNFLFHPTCSGLASPGRHCATWEHVRQMLFYDDKCL